MRLTAVALTIAIGALSSQTAVNAQETLITPNSRGLTIEECLKLVQTETDEEFE